MEEEVEVIYDQYNLADEAELFGMLQKSCKAVSDSEQNDFCLNGMIKALGPYCY